MELKQLKNFLVICEEKNISKAAKRLFMSQPPLSIQLKKLEEELECQLFKRNTRNLEITSAGKLLKEKAINIIKLSEGLSSEIKREGEIVSGSLSIGFIASSGAMLLPNRVHEFYKTYPNINFKVKEGSTYRILEFLENGVIEIGVVRTPFSEQRYECIHLPKEPMVAVATKNFFTNVNETSLQVKQLKELPLLIDKRFFKLISSVCEKNKFTPNVLCHGEDSRSLILWASSGLGVAIIPESSIYLSNTDDLVVLPIDSKELETNIIIAWLKNRPLSPVAEKFIETFN